LEYASFWKAILAYAVLAVVADLLLFRDSYVPLLPGLAVVWGEIGLGFAVNRIAFRLTARAIAVKGVSIEANPVMRRMLATGSLKLLWIVWGNMALVGLLVSVVSIRFGDVWLGMLLLIATLPIAMAGDAANDYYWISRVESEAP
jgi:uncharacterized membrane protein